MNGLTPETTSFSRAAGKPANGRGPATAAQFVDILRTLADPIRMRMLRLLESQPHSASAGLSVGELGEILKLPQSTVSRHLKTLTDSHLAEARREGTSMLYRITDTPTDGGGMTKQLRQLSRTTLENDPLAKTDTQRLSAVLRKRDTEKNNKDAANPFFGKHAPHWDQLRTQWFGETFHLEGLLALLNPNWTIADIGTGTGAMLPLLAPHVQKVIAIDPTPAMLKAAKSRIRDLNLQNVDIRSGSAENLPLDNASLDVALLALVLAYTPDPELVLKEIRRTLKPGGILLLIDLQPHTIDLFHEKLNHRWMGFSQDQLTDWLQSAGFTNVRWHPLASQAARSKSQPVPDLFTLRAEAH